MNELQLITTISYGTGLILKGYWHAPPRPSLLRYLLGLKTKDAPYYTGVLAEYEIHPSINGKGVDELGNVIKQYQIDLRHLFLTCTPKLYIHKDQTKAGADFWIGTLYLKAENYSIASMKSPLKDSITIESRFIEYIEGTSQYRYTFKYLRVLNKYPKFLFISDVQILRQPRFDSLEQAMTDSSEHIRRWAKEQHESNRTLLKVN